MMGPVERISIGGGAAADLFLLRFDKKRTSPQSADSKVCRGGATDERRLHLRARLERYRGFAEGFVDQRTSLGLPTPAECRPLLIGIIWSFTWFVLPLPRAPTLLSKA
jgi:hypothetical protein